MAMVGGFDVHRRQITFDFVDTESGRVQRGRIAPATRAVLRQWLAGRFPAAAGHSGGVHVAVEGCTGWRFVVEELTRAGVSAHLADPAETATARGRKRRAKTDRADARLARDLLVDGDLPECFIPPAHILELRALLELYHDLHQAHHGWCERIHATLFHHGAPKPARLADRAKLAELTAQVSPSAQQTITTATAMLEVIDAHTRLLYRQITRISRQLTGSRLLQQQYGVGPLTAAALLAWLGGANRFSSARKAVRFCGLDITVYSSDDHRAPGHLSRQGPPVLRWLLYEAGMCAARAGSPDRGYFHHVAARGSTTKAALSQARRIVKAACHTLTRLGDTAFTPHQQHTHPRRTTTTATHTTAA